VNARIPDGAPEGCAVPVTLTGSRIASQQATISMSRGRGQCQDPPVASFGSILWKKTFSTGTDQPAASTTEAFSASFASAPENLITPVPQPAPGNCTCVLGFGAPRPGPRCAGTEPKELDAGVLTIDGLASGPIQVNPSSSSGEIAYSVALPPGSIQGGLVSVSTAGGADVGAFQTALSFPPPIRITTPLSPGTVFSENQPFQVTWESGGLDAIVRMKLIYPIPNASDEYCECAALASDQSVTIGVVPSGIGNTFILPIEGGTNNRVVITITPPLATTLPAPGLTQQATHSWTYEYDFGGLTFTSQK
jgi:hypothetical protein